MHNDHPVRPVVPALWVIVPAAGIGTRMRADRPKQYLTLQGQPLIDLTLRALLAHPRIHHVHVALHPEDRWWPQCVSAHDPQVTTYTGGAERADTVWLGLEHLRSQARDDDWVLVHDVARPCVRQADLDALFTQVGTHPVGGLLGVPMADTVKRVANGLVLDTVDRRPLWRAYTPQMFRFGDLDRALRSARHTGTLVTDEASAIEALGLHPLMVEGHSDNIKVTTPADLALAEWTLARLQEQSE